jgi:hypothetical protein
MKNLGFLIIGVQPIRRQSLKVGLSAFPKLAIYNMLTIVFCLIAAFGIKDYSFWWALSYGPPVLIILYYLICRISSELIGAIRNETPTK